jgi:hypothetical protein
MVLEYDDAPAVSYGAFEKFHDCLISIFEITEFDWRNVRTLSAIWRDIREIGGPLNSWYTSSQTSTRNRPSYELDHRIPMERRVEHSVAEALDQCRLPEISEGLLSEQETRSRISRLSWPTMMPHYHESHDILIDGCSSRVWQGHSLQLKSRAAMIHCLYNSRFV